MIDACSRPNCFAPESTCALGHLDRFKCPAWKSRDEAATQSSDENADDLLLPWSGSALGLADLGFVAGRIRPLVVGIAGPHRAGKTTLLAAWYLLLGQGLAKTNDRRLSGSYSLAGWEAVASPLRWSPGQKPGFPPHTSSRRGRAPGLLHLAFMHADGKVRDYLFTDAPGEWFQKWGLNRESAEGEGARWVSAHADVFLLIADREALSGSSMGTARGSFQLLASRIAAERGTRPLALVWTKADVAVTPAIEEAVRKAVFGPMPDAFEYFVSIYPGENSPSDKGQGFLELLDWTLGTRRRRASIPPPIATSFDPLFMFGAK